MKIWAIEILQKYLELVLVKHQLRNSGCILIFDFTFQIATYNHLTGLLHRSL